MSTNYHFIDRETNEPVSLNKIDTLVCAHEGVEVSETDYCFAYQVLTMAGIVIAREDKNGVVTEEGFAAWEAKQDPEDTGPNVIAFYKKFLLTDYKFSTWYQVNF